MQGPGRSVVDACGERSGAGAVLERRAAAGVVGAGAGWGKGFIVVPEQPEVVRCVADELEIRNVIARLALLADAGELDEYLALFTEDASWDMPGGPRRGHADILAGARERRASGTAGPGSATRHVITTVSVRADGSDTATADSYWLFMGDTTATPTVRLMGHYHDTFRRCPDGWKLARRGITFG